MNEHDTSVSKTGSNGFMIAIGAVALVALGLVVYKTKPAAEIAQLPQATTSGIAQPAQVPEPVTTGMAPSNKASANATPPAAEGSTTGMASNSNISNSRSSGGLAQQPGSFAEPRQYQPNNPYPDYRRTVTASDAGIGSSTGTTGTLVK